MTRPPENTFRGPIVPGRTPETYQPNTAMKPLLLNAFSINMLAALPATVELKEITVADARAALASGFDSAVGHKDTAAVFSAELGIPVAENRTTVALAPGAVAVVGQYRGPRLPEGATALPEGARIQWVLLTV